MKASILFAISIGFAGTAVAKDKPAQQAAPPVLTKALNAAVTAQAAPPGQAKPKVDRDQGDDNASDRARNVVCTKDTPAAQRSAICDGFVVSPE